MEWTKSLRWLNAVLLSSALLGCRQPNNVHYLGDADLNFYKHHVTAVEYANVDQETSTDVLYSGRPRTIKELANAEIWNMSLQEAVQIAISNNKMIRTRSNSATLLANPSASPSVFDVAQRDTGFLFGNRGVEAALADFDTTFTTTTTFTRNQQALNTLLLPGFVQSLNQSVVNSGLQKNIATGGTVSLSENWTYSNTDLSSQLYRSNYVGVTQLQFTQPLWAGAGVEYSRIAGPNRSGFGAITGVSQGVSIARINTDISVADFELAVIAMIKDVEDLYWELYLAYRQYDATLAQRDSALRTWQEVNAKAEVGAIEGTAAAEAQARENYFDVRSQVETALSNLYIAENSFRKQCGLPVNDGKVIRPANDPLEGELIVQWDLGLADALTRRVELRRQKWQIKSLELQRIAAENVANPQLNFVSSYQVNGFGRTLGDHGTFDPATGTNFNSAYGSMLRGNETGWGLGLQFSVPIGLRAARAQLRNTELQLVEARVALAAQELDISHDLANSIQNMDVSFVTAKTNFDRFVAAARRVRATEAEYAVEKRNATLDLVLRAQAARATAQVNYFTSLVRYNQAITNMHLQRGTLLENNGIHLSEGDWTPMAYKESLRRAWARSFGMPNQWLDTQPDEFASPVAYPKGVISGQVVPKEGSAPYEETPAEEEEE